MTKVKEMNCEAREAALDMAIARQGEFRRKRKCPGVQGEF